MSSDKSKSVLSRLRNGGKSQTRSKRDLVWTYEVNVINDQLLSRLNEAVSSPAVARVNALLEAFVRTSVALETLTKKGKQALQSYERMICAGGIESSIKPVFQNAEIADAYEDFLEGRSLICSMLDRYRWFFKFDLSPVPRLTKTLSFHPVGETVDHPWEEQAVKVLLSHMPGEGPHHSYRSLESLWRFRHCKKCKKWFYARQPSQFFCSDLCRTNWDAQASAPKERRKKYMKEEYRPNEKARIAAQQAAYALSEKRRGPSSQGGQK